MHTCPMSDGPKPHVGGPVAGPGVPTVLIGGQPAAVVGDIAVCVGPPDALLPGSPTVLIGGRPSTRVGDMTAHGGTIVGPGCPTVLIGESGSSGGSAGGGAAPSTGTGAAAAAGTVKEGNLKKVSDSRLRQMGVDEHALKRDFVVGESISHYNIAVESGTD